MSLDERIFNSAIGALELQAMHLGRALGLYPLLVEPKTASALADAAGIHPRYAREWLEQQATAGYVSADLTGSEPSFFLNEEQQTVLVDADHPAHVSPFADMIAGGGSVLDRVVDAFRSGGGVPYADYGKAFRDGQAGINRPAFKSDLTSSWLGAVPDVVERLRKGGRVADLGCGAGWSTIAVAKEFPKAKVFGIDADEASIEDAIANADGADVEFLAADATSLAEHGPFDLVLLLEVLHDLSRPVEVLAAVQKALSGDGALLIADEKVGESFAPNGDELERMMYGWSVSYCLPASLAEENSAAIGTVFRPAQLKELAAEAGFGSVEISDVDAGFFRLYVLRP